jgi:undecaprenyl-diphosphatase
MGNTFKKHYSSEMKQYLSKVIQWIKDFLRKKLRYQNEDLPYYISISAAILIFVIGLKVFVELTDELSENELENFDDQVTGLVLSFRSDTLTSFFEIVTDLGDRYAYVIITIALGTFFWFRFKNWKFMVQTVSVLVLASLSNIGLKQVINRARPTLEHLVEVNTLSFPSGHTMSAMAFYGFLVYLCLRYNIHNWLRIPLVIILCMLIVSIGLSRIYLGVHYPSDVAAGFMGGLIWVTLCAIILNTIELWRKKKGDRLTTVS